MIARRRLRSHVPVLLALLLPLFNSGCREELGPEHFPTTRVSGLIIEGGKAVPGGWIEFLPTDGTVGNLRSARIHRDGTFEADRVAIGKNAIRLVDAPIQIPGGASLFGRYDRTPIRRTIAAFQQAPLKIDLLEEAARYQAAHSRARRPRAQPAGGLP